MVALVTYDLRQPGRNYEPLYTLLKSVPHDHPLESVWLLRTLESVQSLSDKIKAIVDSNDLHFVVDISNAPHSGWLPRTSWDWLRQHAVIR